MLHNIIFHRAFTFVTESFDPNEANGGGGETEATNASEEPVSSDASAEESRHPEGSLRGSRGASREESTSSDGQEEANQRYRTAWEIPVNDGLPDVEDPPAGEDVDEANSPCN